MTTAPASAIAAVTGDVEALAGPGWTRPPAFEAGEVADIRAAVSDAGASLVTVPIAGAGGERWRCFAREGDCLVSVVSPDLADVARAVESVRVLARECREATA